MRGKSVEEVNESIKRYFFNGITEEVVKEAVPGVEEPDAFSFTQKENGESAGEWDRCGGPAGWSIASASDETHRSNVIRCQGASGNMFIIGDDNNTNYNSHDTPWNSTERALSFWYRGNWVQMSVMLSTNVGERMLYYHAASGTNYCDENDHVHIYLSASAESNSWQRFDRNTAADYEAYETETWSNTDGVIIEFGSGDTDFLIDDIRLSNSTTKEFNSLNGGSTGQIISQYTFEDGSPQRTQSWLSYDRLGNVRGQSDPSGDVLAYADMDAYGNVLSSVNTGAWASTFSGRHLTTKEYDSDAEMYWFWARWYDSAVGGFLSPEILGLRKTRYPYSYCRLNPGNLLDPLGDVPVPAPTPDPPPPPTPRLPSCTSPFRPGMIGLPVPFDPLKTIGCSNCAEPVGDIEGKPGCKQCHIIGFAYGDHYFQACDDCTTMECLHMERSDEGKTSGGSTLCRFFGNQGPCYIINYIKQYGPVTIDCGGSPLPPCSESCMSGL